MPGDQRHRMRHSVRRGFSSGDFTVSWAAPGTPGREAEGGCAHRVPQSPHIPSVEQSREPPRPQTMPECGFNKYNTTSPFLPCAQPCNPDRLERMCHSGHGWTIPLCKGVGGIEHDIVLVGASDQGEVSCVAPGVTSRGAIRRGRRGDHAQWKRRNNVVEIVHRGNPLSQYVLCRKTACTASSFMSSDEGAILGIHRLADLRVVGAKTPWTLFSCSRCRVGDHVSTISNQVPAGRGPRLCSIGGITCHGNSTSRTQIGATVTTEG